MRLRGLFGAAALFTVLPCMVPAESEARIHEVRPGETLWTIAAITVGDPTLWPALYLANRDQIKDPGRIYPNQRLQIPTEVDEETRRLARLEAGAPPERELAASGR